MPTIKLGMIGFIKLMVETENSLKSAHFQHDYHDIE